MEDRLDSLRISLKHDPIETPELPREKFERNLYNYMIIKDIRKDPVRHSRSREIGHWNICDKMEGGGRPRVSRFLLSINWFGNSL